MKVSVLVNNYNYGPFLRQCLQSAKSQGYPNLQIVVVDDGSTDDSRQILKQVEAGIEVVCQANGGQLSAIAAGLRLCSGDYIFLLDSDDFWPADYVCRLIEGIERHGRPDVVFAGITDVDKNGAHIRIAQSVPQDVDYGYNYLISRYAPTFLGHVTSTIAIRRSVLTAILAKSESLAGRYRVNADEVIVVGADLLGYRKVFLADISIFYRVHGDNAWTNAAWDQRRKHEYFLLRTMLYSVLKAGLFDDANPYLRLHQPFAEEFESKSGVPFAEAVRYLKAVLLHGHARRLRQAWRIFMHWRLTGTSRNRFVRHLLKSAAYGQ